MPQRLRRKTSGQILSAPKINRQFQQSKAPQIPRYLELLTIQLNGLHLPLPVCEYQWHPNRKWTFDFCWPAPNLMLAMEVNGGLFIQGGHSRGASYWADTEKYNEATLMGWRVLVVTPSMLELEDGRAAFLLERALKIPTRVQL